MSQSEAKQCSCAATSHADPRPPQDAQWRNVSIKCCRGLLLLTLENRTQQMNLSSLKCVRD